MATEPTRGRRPTVVEVWTWVSETDVKKQAGRGSSRSSSTELQSWGMAELARSVRFRQGTGTGLRDDRLIHSRIDGDTDLGGTAFGGPPVGQGDPGVKPGAFLPGPPLFFRSRREDHGPNGNGPNGYDLNGYVWVIVWVVGPDSPGLTGTHRDSPGLTVGRFALGSKANGQGGDGAPPRGRRPTVVDGRTWVSGTGVKKQAGLGSARSSSANEGKLAPEHRDQVPGRGESGTE